MFTRRSSTTIKSNRSALAGASAKRKLAPPKSRRSIQSFRQGAAEGISFYAAAGDDGAYDCGDTNLGVDSPADDPNVTGVGGTSLTLNGSAYGSETVWSCNTGDCTQNAPEGEGGGGGVSLRWSASLISSQGCNRQALRSKGVLYPMSQLTPTHKRVMRSIAR